MYNRKKYNIILVTLVLIISIFVGCGASISKMSSISIDPSQNSEMTPPDMDIPVPDDDDEEEKPASAPVFYNGFQAINYALDIMHNGKGFTSFFHQQIQATVVITVTQNIKIKKYRGGGQDFTEEWYYSDGSIGSNDSKFYYSDGTNMKIYTVPKGNYSTSKLTYNPKKAVVEDEFTVDHYENTMQRNKLNNFFQPINSSNSNILFFDKNDGDNYKVKVRVDPDKVDKTYISTFEANGAKINKYYELTLTFTINKSTGYLVECEKKEKINTTYAGTFTGDAVITSREFFYNMNKSMESTIKEKIALFPN